jgi:alpha-L-rhamnosidase/F5/8 type C domain
MKKQLLLKIFFVSISTSLLGQNLSEKDFQNPANQYKPKTWMHAMSANMSKEGLTKDLESLKEVGIGGFLLFNISQGIPKGKVVYNSPEHHEMITHAAKESERLGLSFGVHNCDGWSSSGGPWVTPEQSMKMVVWTEQVVKGGEKLSIKLNQPTIRAGLYKDIAVLAYPSFASEISDNENRPIITSSDKNFKTSIVNDQNWEEESMLKPEGKNKSWVQFDYGKPHTIRSFFSLHNARNATFQLATSEDGINFGNIKNLKKVRTGKGEWGNNVNFEPMTARYFRVMISENVNIKELKLLSTYLIDNQLGRTAIARTEMDDLDPIGSPTPDMVIDKNKILDLTHSLNQNGELNTKLPEGNWTILRFGYTSTAAVNTPSSIEGRGLEVDKLNRAAFKTHYDAFVKKVVDNGKKVAPNALQYVEIDSYEMGGQSWTDSLDVIFKKEKGYNLKGFLPLFAGRFVENEQSSEDVLMDFRDVVTNLMTENYFGYFQQLCHKDGLKTYIEPYGFGPLNDLDVGSKADIPMGEFWMNRDFSQVPAAISAGHIYGRKIISAESFTTEPGLNWKGHPAMAKISGDKAWALGINEFMFHRFAHQANTHVEPGMTMNRWGFHFDRTQTWWYNAGASWFQYISRGSYLLQQGVPVSDLLVFVGDFTPNSVVKNGDFKPKLSKGIHYNSVNFDVLLNRITVKNGEMVLPEGGKYKVLVLKNSHKIKFKTLQRLQELANQGVPIVGEKPKGLIGYNLSKTEQGNFTKMIAEIWSKPNVQEGFDWNSIFKKYNIEADFAIEGREDIEFMHRKMSESDSYFFYNPDSVARTFNVKFKVKNKLPERWDAMDGSIKKLAQFTQKGNYTHLTIQLKPQESSFIVFKDDIQNAVSIVENKYSDIDFAINKNNKLTAQIAKNGTYLTTLSNGKTWNFSEKKLPDNHPIKGSWQISFNAKSGFGGIVTFPELIDWKDHALDSIRYYSGTAIYKKSFELNKNQVKAGTRLILDLGKVNIVAKVKLNDKDLGVSWLSPFEIDITEVAKQGTNLLEIEITNQWSNRLIGEERFPANDGDYKMAKNSNNVVEKMPDWYVKNQPRPQGQRTTFTTADFYKKDDPLMPSGLLGPVQIKFMRIVEKKD